MKITKIKHNEEKDTCDIKNLADGKLYAFGWESGEGLGYLTARTKDNKGNDFQVKLTHEDFNKIYQYAVEKKFI